MEEEEDADEQPSKTKGRKRKEKYIEINATYVTIVKGALALVKEVVEARGLNVET